MILYIYTVYIYYNYIHLFIIYLSPLQFRCPRLGHWFPGKIDRNTESI